MIGVTVSTRLKSIVDASTCENLKLWEFDAHTFFDASLAKNQDLECNMREYLRRAND